MGKYSFKSQIKLSFLLRLLTSRVNCNICVELKPIGIHSNESIATVDCSCFWSPECGRKLCYPIYWIMDDNVMNQMLLGFIISFGVRTLSTFVYLQNGIFLFYTHSSVGSSFSTPAGGSFNIVVIVIWCCCCYDSVLYVFFLSFVRLIDSTVIDFVAKYVFFFLLKFKSFKSQPKINSWFSFGIIKSIIDLKKMEIQ